MHKVTTVIIALFATAFALLGASWYVSPPFAADLLDMQLLDGRGLGTQIADLGSFFLTLGACMLLGLLTNRASWFYAAMLLMGIATVGRLVAWLVHGAGATVDMMAVEILMIVVLYFRTRGIRAKASDA